MPSCVSSNVRKILSELPPGVSLVAVVKTRSATEIKTAFDAGVRYIGENRLQEAKKHFSDPLFPSLLEKHFIGHLQSNKARDAALLFDVIESVDSVKLARKLDAACFHLNKRMPVFLEVNIGTEVSKHGFSVQELPAAFNEIRNLSNLDVLGLMCIPPVGEDPRPFFKKSRELCVSLGLNGLSMGMSSDYKVAVEEGATLVRIGAGIFGPR